MATTLYERENSCDGLYSFIRTFNLERGKNIMFRPCLAVVVVGGGGGGEVENSTRNPSLSQIIFSPHITEMLILKAYANGRNIVCQQHATLLSPTCCVRLHGTITMLALVGTCCV